VFDDADKEFDLLFNAIRAGRSLAASYNLQSDIQSTSPTAKRRSLLKRFWVVFLHIRDGAEAALFESQKGVITTLTKGCKSVEVVRDAGEIPPGCGSTVLTSTIGVHILVRVRPAVYLPACSL
jgi:valyl-tRNA synthetase